MPMFEYQCEECSYIFEELIFGVNATNEISCPKCKSENTEKLMSAPSIGSSSCEYSTESGCSAPLGSGFS